MRLESADIAAAARQDAAARYPEESCGIITAAGYVAIENAADDPRAGFRMPPGVWAEFDIQAIVHSHRWDQATCPTAADMRAQIDSGLPWGLVMTDGVRTEGPYYWGAGIADGVPLDRRTYRHGPTGTDNAGDCYAIIRDWFRVHRRVELPEVPRDDEWWAAGGDLYREGFGPAGFDLIGPPGEHRRDLRLGDVLLMQIRSDVPNHGAVYVGAGRIAHHPAPLWRPGDGQMSRVADPGERWIAGYATHLLRYRGAQ